MKAKIYLFIGVILITSALKVNSQIIITKNDTISIEQDTIVKLVLPEYRGDIQWQKSKDSVVWEDLQGEINDTLIIKTDTGAIYRAVIKEGACNLVYSDTVIFKIDVDFAICDISQESEWNYWVVGKKDYYYLKVENSLPHWVLYHSSEANKDYSIFFTDSGELDKVVVDDYIFIFRNFRESVVDIGILYPTGYIDTFRNVETNYDWTNLIQKSANSVEELSDIVRWTGRIVGGVPCALSVVAAFNSAGILAPLALWSCGNYFLKLSADMVTHEFDTQTGFSEFMGEYSDVSLILNCSGVSDPISCASSAAAKGFSELADYLEQIENEKKEDIQTIVSYLSSGTFTDNRDGHIYKTIKIGEQIWMAENFAYLPEVSPPSMESTTTPYYYVSGYNGTNVEAAKATTNYSTYGVLYNWPAALASCPSGWHMPSIDELSTLVNFLGGFDIAGGKLKETGTTHWESPNIDATNEIGFTGLPGGYRTDYNSGIFLNLGNTFIFWTEFNNSSSSWCLENRSGKVLGFGNWDKNYGQSVRYIKD